MVNIGTLEDGTWVALQVHCGCEKTVSAGLRLRGYEEFLPLYRVPASRYGAKRSPERALFPGYLFCRYARNARFRMIEVPGVMRLVGSGKTVIPIPDCEIDSIRRVVDSGLHSEPWKFLQVGEYVTVAKGVLRGLRGILVAVKKGTRLVLGIPLLGRAVAVEIDAEDVLPLRHANPAPQYASYNVSSIFAKS